MITTVGSVIIGIITLLIGFFKWRQLVANDTKIIAAEAQVDKLQAQDEVTNVEHAKNTPAIDLLNELHTSSKPRS